MQTPTFNTLKAGLIMAASVALSDCLNAWVIHPQDPLSWQALLVAVFIGVAGWVGKTYTGSTNTVIAMGASALLTVIPMLTSGSVNWNLVAVTIAIKFLGVVTDKKGVAEKREVAP